MGSMTWVHLQVLGATKVCALPQEKANIQMFISGLLISFKDKIEFDEPRSLDESIRKLKN